MYVDDVAQGRAEKTGGRQCYALAAWGRESDYHANTWGLERAA